MVVYRNEFSRLRGIQFYRKIGCVLDVWNISDDMLTLIDEFFDLQPSHWWMLMSSHLLNYRLTNNIFYFNDEAIFSGVNSAEFVGVIALGAYNLLAFSINDEGSDSLVAISRKSSQIIGYISAHGSKTSSEFARLIVSTPEVDWQL